MTVSPAKKASPCRTTCRTAPRRSLVSKKKHERLAKKDVEEALVQSFSVCAVTEKVLRVADAKRRRVVADVEGRGYHLLVGSAGVLRAVIVQRPTGLVDSLTGRTVLFREGRSNWADHLGPDGRLSCQSDDEAISCKRRL
mmetsp:Transcript_18655/g.57351  ORF Transcript_18655/g.57351 Transcript_18655/m.57351 type:complete len:140 (+) Transcript_18655:956-1375(+)